MLRFFRNAAIAATLSISIAAPGFAQTVDTSAVEAACVPAEATEGGCLSAIEAFIASLAGLPAVEADAALGVLATALASSSLNAGANTAVIAVALSAIAPAITDPAQATQVAALATAVETGTDLPVAAVGAPTPASPA